jgi:diguanylate cyclase (GGDEF)-like protein/PAS domain S-box-containing protein
VPGRKERMRVKGTSKKTDLPRSRKGRIAWAASKLADVDILRIILQHAHDKIYFKDRRSRFLLVSQNHAWCFRVREAAEIIGTDDSHFFRNEHAGQTKKDEARIMRTGRPMLEIVEKEPWTDGRLSWVSSSKYPLRDRKGRIVGTWGLSRDITDLVKAEEKLVRVNLELSEANAKLSRLSLLDPLSELHNHRHFYEVVRKAYKLRSRSADAKAGFSVVMFDVDHFKDVNDRYGHLAGDQVIRHVGRLAVSAVRATDTAFRLGGDEFVLFLPSTGLEAARKVAEKVRILVKKTACKCGKRRVSVTLSAGVAWSDEARDVNVLLRKADDRMYKSKRGGRDRVT